MSLHDPRQRRLARGLARVATILCAVALGITIWGMSLSGIPRASAVPVAGVAYVVTPPGAPGGANQPLTSGGSATAFSLRVPVGAACAGDSANGGYRVQGYMVPVAVDPATLTFDAAGPVPTGLGATFKQPLFETTGTGYVDAQTANADPAGGPGPVINIPGFDLAVFAPDDIPAGTYNLGIACTLGPASATQLDRYWNTELVVTTTPADMPAGVTWTAAAAPVVTTTSTTEPTSTSSTSTSSTSTSSTSTSSTSTSTSSTTSSTTSTSTSTTTPSGSSTTSTTSTDGTTTTEGTDGSTDGLFDGGTADGGTTDGGTPGGGAPIVAGTTTLPLTGSSTVALIVWAVLLVVFGRMAVLLGRPPRVIPSLRAR